MCQGTPEFRQKNREGIQVRDHNRKNIRLVTDKATLRTNCRHASTHMGRGEVPLCAHLFKKDDQHSQK